MKINMQKLELNLSSTVQKLRGRENNKDAAIATSGKRKSKEK